MVTVAYKCRNTIDNNNLHGNSSLQVPQHSIDNNNLHGNSSLQVPQHYR